MINTKDMLGKMLSKGLTKDDIKKLSYIGPSGGIHRVIGLPFGAIGRKRGRALRSKSRKKRFSARHPVLTMGAYRRMR